MVRVTPIQNIEEDCEMYFTEQSCRHRNWCRIYKHMRKNNPVEVKQMCDKSKEVPC